MRGANPRSRTSRCAGYEGELLNLNPRLVGDKLTEVNSRSEVLREDLADSQIAANLLMTIEQQMHEFEQHMPLIKALLFPGMRDRHWKKLHRLAFHLPLPLTLNLKFTVTVTLVFAFTLDLIITLNLNLNIALNTLFLALALSLAIASALTLPYEHPRTPSRNSLPSVLFHAH